MARSPISKTKESDVIGLARNPEGVKFGCPTCEYFTKGICYNNRAKLHGHKVDAQMCCNLYDHAGMEVVLN